MSENPAGSWPTRLPLLIMLLLISIGAFGTAPIFVVSVPLALLLLVAAATTRSRRKESLSARPAALVVAALGVLISLPLLIIALRDAPLVVPVGVGCLALGSSMMATFRPRLIYLHLSVMAAYLVILIRGIHPHGDVRTMAEGSLHGLLSGANPYALTFKNPYDATDTAAFWSPDFILGDRINVGYPYLPGSLVGDLPGYLIGDLRYSSALAVLVTTALAWRLTSDVVGRALVAALPASVLSSIVVIGYWVEPLVLLGVAIVALAMARGRGGLGFVGLFILLTTKQYIVVALPLEKLIRERLGAKCLLAAVGAAAMLAGGFFLVGPADFWRSVVLVQLKQPLRDDSLSLTVDLVAAGVHIPLALTSALAIVAGLSVSFWIRQTAPASATWTALGVGLAMLATVLLSKQGMVNYYFLIHGCLVIGMATWPRDLGTSPAQSMDAEGERQLVEGNQ